MLNITKEYIDSVATNASACKKGRELANEGSFIKLNKSEDETIIFGECTGSGKKNYLCSADFSNESSPVYRCNCPSRQFPCKHALGLLYSFADEKEFTIEEIPEDILEKRKKVEKREKNKDEKKKTPKKKNKTALKKKINAQLEGLEFLDKILSGILKRGFGAITKDDMKELKGQIKELGNYYIPNVQTQFKRVVGLFEDKDTDHAIIMEEMTYLKSITKKGKEHLLNRLEDEELNLAVDSNIEEVLGHAWKLTELEELGQFKKDVKLVQLSFSSWKDEERGENVDEGIFLNLNTGEIQKTYNYRPVKRKSDPKGEYKVSSLLEIPTLYTYPGDLNPRIRWEEMILKEMDNTDYEKAFSYVQKSYAEVVKTIKNKMKNPLHDKSPLALLHYAKIGKIQNQWVIEDENGKRLALSSSEHGACGGILSMLNPEYMTDKAILVRFYYDYSATKSLEVCPISIVGNDKIMRLTV